MKRSGGRAWLAALAAGCAALAVGVGVAGAQQPAKPAKPPAQSSAQGSASSDPQSVQIKSDNFEGLRDQGRYIYTGNVEVVDGKSRLIADKLTLICDQPATPAPKTKAKSEGVGAGPTCEINQLIAESNVFYFLDDDKVRGDRAQYDYANRVITVTGTAATPVVLSRADKGVMSGPKLVYDVNKGVARMSGLNAGDRITSLFVPKDENAPAPPAPGQSTVPAPSAPAQH